MSGPRAVTVVINSHGGVLTEEQIRALVHECLRRRTWRERTSWALARVDRALMYLHGYRRRRL